jgi:hypothetical protein
VIRADEPLDVGDDRVDRLRLERLGVVCLERALDRRAAAAEDKTDAEAGREIEVDLRRVVVHPGPIVVMVVGDRRAPREHQPVSRRRDRQQLASKRWR